MWAELGNHEPKNAYRQDIKPNDYTVEQLRQLAQERTDDPMADGGVAVDDNPTKELLAARLSGQILFEPREGKCVTRVNFPEGVSIREAFTTLVGLWRYHSDASPAWVQSDSPGLTALACEEWGCKEGVPKNLEAEYWTDNGPPGIGPDGPARKGAAK